MGESNMERFDKCAVFIFSILYQSFPNSKDLVIKTFPDYDTEESNEIFFSIIDFLAEEGFIKYEKKVYGGYIGVRLTMRGLAVLRSIPKSIDQSETLGEKAVEVASTGAMDAVKTVIGQILGQFLGL